MELICRGEQPIFQQEVGTANLFSEHVKQVLVEMRMEEDDAKDIQLLMEHAGELVLNRAQNERPRQPLTMGHNAEWFRKTLLDLCKADPFLQFYAEKPGMERCVMSIFSIVNGAAATHSEFSRKLRSAHQDFYLTDARYTVFIAHIDKVLRAMFPWPVHPAAVANGNIRSLEGLRTEVLCGSTLRHSRLQVAEGIISGADGNKQKVVRKDRSGRVMSAMKNCARALFNGIASDSRVSFFFKNSDPECKDRKARYIGCALGGHLPATVDSHETQSSAASTSSGSSAANPGLSLRRQHRLLRISDYHFDVFLEHVHKALAAEDMEASDLAPAQLETLRENVVLPSMRSQCPFSGATGKGSCPFHRVSQDSSLLDRIGGQEAIDKILTDMEREAASRTMLVPFLRKTVKLTCHEAILKQLVSAAAGEDPPQLEVENLQIAHSRLGLLPEHCSQWLSCFNVSMVSHILPPEIAQKLNTCFMDLITSITPLPAEKQKSSKADLSDDWGQLQGLMDELGGEEGLGRLIEAWYHYISQEPSINTFFTGTRPQVMMFQTKFWSEVLREGLHPDGRRQLQIISIHQHLRITNSHFDCFVQCLIQACEKLSLSKDSSNNMRAAVELFRQQIVSEL